MSAPDLIQKDKTKPESRLLPDLEAEKTSKRNFAVFAASVFLLNYDTGMFPMAVKLIMKDIDINHAEVAFMGSSVNAGLSFGSLLVPFLYRKFTAKRNLIACLILHMVSMTTFALISQYETMVLLRFISGIAAGGHLIYFPVWINNFGPKKVRATWIAFVNLANPIGTTCGIVFSMIFLITVNGIYKWRLPAAVQMALEFILLILIARMRNEDIDVSVKSEADSEEFLPRDAKTFFRDFFRTLKNPMVMIGTFCYCAMFFTLAGLQFWSVLYMETIYGVKKEQAVVYYLTISFLACLIGIYSGGFIVDKLV